VYSIKTSKIELSCGTLSCGLCSVYYEDRDFLVPYYDATFMAPIDEENPWPEVPGTVVFDGTGESAITP